jgi:hypothetical protein
VAKPATVRRVRRVDLTVVMPTYNGERYLATALESLCGSGQPDEVIVCDDGSTDGTLSIAGSFASRLPLRVLRPGRRGSWTAMTNIGLQEVRGTWTAILHQDDFWMPGRRLTVERFFESEADLVLTEAMYVDESGRAIGRWRMPRAVLRRPQLAPASLFVQNWVAVPAATFRTAAALDVGGLDESLWYTADWDLWLKLSKRTPLLPVPSRGAAFRVHSGSQTVTGSRDSAAFREQLVTVQNRHRWAADTHPRSQAYVSAGALSTETNVMLASAFHGGPDLSPWAKAVGHSIRRRAIGTYVRNSALRDRLSARLRMKLRP